jgi:hypothetical protein
MENNIFESVEDKARRLGVPIISKKQGQLGFDQIVSICGDCGLELKRQMMYSCPRADCPCGLGSLSVGNLQFKQESFVSGNVYDNDKILGTKLFDVVDGKAFWPNSPQPISSRPTFVEQAINENVWNSLK